ncbi:hypothetical protein [Paenibacillus sp. UMB4589-SE434]|uniref:hypothetical protein n=1 Tax=Paenibacillus sp. UMB4589-SE434 TaxID=3046314 RepID=UPI00254DADC6|nr:hypothetical protein [Paenibacillus sp. UMB4589-SE434]MDK8179582.1 hypothetical protein [Paenibacillus sp. UMB4589-SE434]
MKTKIIVILTMITVVMGIFFIWYFTPKKYSETLDGVYYQLGKEGIIEHVKVHIDGKLENHINGNKTFRGFIDFKGDKIPQIPKERAELELHYDGQKFTTIFSPFQKINGDLKGRIRTDIYQYGWMYTNDKFTDFTIKLTMNGSISLSEGYMITFPAKDRAEAMNKSQRLIKEFEQQ